MQNIPKTQTSKPLKSGIAPAAVQELFQSARNAADKGQAQWFTLWKAFHNVKYAKVEVMERLGWGMAICFFCDF